MNIVVIGSCTDSSNLAKELNRQLPTSIVARVDILKQLKQLLLSGIAPTTKEFIGTYIGDVETYDYSKLSKDLKDKVSTTMLSIMEGSSKSGLRSIHNISTFNALTSGIPSGTYSFIKVYSGAISTPILQNVVNEHNFLSEAIFVKINSPEHALLPVNVSNDILTSIKKNAFAFVEGNKVEDILKSDVFKLLFDLSNEPEKKVTVKEEIPPPDMVVDIIDAEEPQVQHAGLLQQIHGEMMAQAMAA